MAVAVSAIYVITNSEGAAIRAYTDKAEAQRFHQMLSDVRTEHDTFYLRMCHLVSGQFIDESEQK